MVEEWPVIGVACNPCRGNSRVTPTLQGEAMPNIPEAGW
jgi:hypothetical protein